MRICLLAFALALPSHALAQGGATPGDRVKERGKTVDEVVVTAAPAGEVQASIDRRSYSVAKEVQASAGTLADLLRTLPSVDVDAQGGVTLRGDAGVTITIDGKPSGMFRGEGRAQAVQSLPANQFERVEVITNPSAAESAEGSAGIINLVSKTSRKAGVSGSVRSSVGTFGQYAAGASLNYNAAKLSLSSDVSYRGGDPQRYRAVDARRVATPAGEAGSVITTQTRGIGHIFSSRLGADYDADARTRFGAQLRYMKIAGWEANSERFEDHDALGRAALSVREVGRSPFDNEITEGSLSFRRKLGEDQELTADLRQERGAYQFGRPDRTTFVTPPRADVFGVFQGGAATNTTGGKVNYKRPLSDGGELKAGYELRIDDNRYYSLVAHGPAPDALAIDVGLSGAFDYRAEIHGAFVTYQRRWDDLTALAGLRLEDANVAVGPSSGAGEETHRLRPYPSLHLSYALDDIHKLNASYSRRVERPSPFQLNPAVSFQNDRAIRSGNPRLKPPETDSFEIGYEDRTAGKSLTTTLFYRHIHDALTSVTTELDDGVLLTRPENLGSARRAGASVSLNRKLTSLLTATLNGDVYWHRIVVSGLPGENRSGYGGSGRASLSWQATPADLFQADVRAVARTITPQGDRTGYAILNLGYRRRLTPTLFAIVSGQNLLDSAGTAERIRTPTLTYRRSFRGLGPTVTFGLTYSFGGKASPPPAIDYGAGS